MQINMVNEFHIRQAERKDSALIVKYIRDLASFEDELDQVAVTAKVLEKNMFEESGTRAIIGVYENQPIGFALYHQSFSTFLGQKGIALVDLYIEPDMRNRGFGKAMISYLANQAITEGCGRLEWWCHDWNKSAIRIYKNWGAFPIDNIRVYRLTGEALSRMGSREG